MIPNEDTDIKFEALRKSISFKNSFHEEQIMIEFNTCDYDNSSSDDEYKFIDNSSKLLKFDVRYIDYYESDIFIMEGDRMVRYWAIIINKNYIYLKIAQRGYYVNYTHYSMLLELNLIFTKQKMIFIIQ